MEAESDLVNLVAWDKFVSNQVTKQSADNVYHPCLFFFFPGERGILAFSEISSERNCLPRDREGNTPVREDNFLHVVGHEEVVEAPALIPLHEGFLGPGRTTSDSERDCVLERRGWGWRGQEAELLPLESAGSLRWNVGLDAWSSSYL